MAGLPVRIITSTRRKKTVAARVVAGTIEVRVPAGLDPAERDELVSRLVAKLQSKRAASDVDLSERARRLSDRYDLPRPGSIVWSTRQRQSWGSCSPETGAIRISTRLADFPDWVLDYVVVHELAHLVEPGHTARFHELVGRYAKAERAEGFLEAVSMGHAGTVDDRPAILT